MHRYALRRAHVEFIVGDITEAQTVAVGNAANSLLMGGGGVDGAIHRAAGGELLEALREIKRTLPGGVLDTGQAVITPGFGLSAAWVIHCVGPIYQREGKHAAKLLASCYRSALELCRDKNIESVAFPSISTGVYGYPVEEAAPVALEAVRRSLTEGGPSLCQFVLFDEPTLQAYLEAAEKTLKNANSARP
jgi:O-acetyl-ADP-ribose deacetylase (regulator of RNase III)